MIKRARPVAVLLLGAYLTAGWVSVAFAAEPTTGEGTPVPYPPPPQSPPQPPTPQPAASPGQPPPDPEALDSDDEVAAAVAASERARDHALEISAGLGITSASEDETGRDVEGTGTGGYGQVEYVYRRVPWATPRAYAGFLITFPEGDCGVTPCDVSSKIGFLGVKLRLMAPIPYFGPFIELGIGGTVGSLRTRAGAAVDITHAGFTYHIPVTLGIALGRRHQYTLALHFLDHPEQRQSGGGFAFGIGFPLP